MLNSACAKQALKFCLYNGAAHLLWISGMGTIRNLPSRANSLRVLMYHKICDRTVPALKVGTAEFRRQQETLAANYRVISLNDLADCVDGTVDLPPRAVLLTFDDGYENNFTNAYPILKEYNHRATIFVPTDFIGSGILPHDRRLANPECVVSWEHLLSMLDVFEVGAHGCSHRILSRMEREAYEREIRDSKAVLEAGLGREVRAFAYPKGSIGDFNADTERAVRAAGFKFCFTTIPGTNLEPMCALRLKRLNVESFGMAYFKRLLDGCADIVGIKDTHWGYGVKRTINRMLDLDH
jgi:peptidoglycan/xylan/chitin deacetylase (PgdA/CDA1 family)